MVWKYLRVLYFNIIKTGLKLKTVVIINIIFDSGIIIYTFIIVIIAKFLKIYLLRHQVTDLPFCLLYSLKSPVLTHKLSFFVNQLN